MSGKCERLPDENLGAVSAGINYERLKVFSVVTEDKDGNTVYVKRADEVSPDKHYWLDPHSGRPGDWMVLGYGKDGDAERFIRAINGENTLNLKDIASLSECYSDLV